MQIGGEDWLVNKPQPIHLPSTAEIVVNESLRNYQLNGLAAERNLYLQPVDRPED